LRAYGIYQAQGDGAVYTIRRRTQNATLRQRRSTSKGLDQCGVSRIARKREQIMRLRTVDTLPIALAGALVLTAAGPRHDSQTRQIERGRYLAHSVAMCVQCHTPRDHEGNLILERAFEGAPVPLPQPPWRTEWAAEAPAIAGLPGLEEQFLVPVLTTGQRPSGRVPLPPMPPFRMSREDAEAVAAYLRSLP
jgi:mono/diheme cytochrome c family protein